MYQEWIFLFFRIWAEDMSEVKGLSPKSCVLVIDDQAGTSELLRIGLNKLGVENIVFAPDGYLGLRALKRYPVDFTICRATIGGLSLCEMVTESLADVSLRWRPTVAFDVNFSNEGLAKFKRLGVEYTFTLPISHKGVTDALVNAASKQLDPNYVFARLEQARVFCNEGKFEESEKIIQSLFDSDRLSFRAKIRHVHLKRFSGEFEVALKLCQDMIKRNAQEFELYDLLGEIHLQMQDVAGAVEAFAKSIEVDARPIRYETVATLLAKAQCHKEAEKFYRRALDANHKTQGILDGIAASLTAQNLRQEALPFFAQLAEEFPTDIKFLNNLAICYKALGNLEGAIEKYNKALEVDPKNSKIMYNLGLIYFDKKQTDAAKELYKKALEIEPNNERMQLKILQIDDPEAYAKRMKEIQAAGGLSRREEQYVYKPKPIKLDDDANATIDAMIGALKTVPKPSAFRPVATPSYKMDAESVRWTQNVDDIKLKYDYLSAVKVIREGYEVITKAWLNPLVTSLQQGTVFIADLCFKLYLSEKRETQESLDEIRVASDLEAMQKLMQKHAALAEQTNIFIHHYNLLKSWTDNIGAIPRMLQTVRRMPEQNLWNDVAKLFTAPTENEMIQKAFASFAGKIPERPGPELAEAEGDFPRRVANIETDFAHWRLCNMIMKKMYDNFSNRLDESFPESLKFISTICGMSFSDAVQRKRIFDVLQASTQTFSAGGVAKLEECLAKSDNVSPVFMALIRSYRCQIEIRRKVLACFELNNLIANTHVDQIGPVAIKDRMAIYSTQLDYVWMHAACRSRSAPEKESFKILIENAKKREAAAAAAAIEAANAPKSTPPASDSSGSGV